jgi:hypothetical protein
MPSLTDVDPLYLSFYSLFAKTAFARGPQQMDKTSLKFAAPSAESESESRHFSPFVLVVWLSPFFPALLWLGRAVGTLGLGKLQFYVRLCFSASALDPLCTRIFQSSQQMATRGNATARRRGGRAENTDISRSIMQV